MTQSVPGLWRIVEMEQWDRDYLDLDGPAHISFDPDGTGRLHFGCVDAGLEWKIEQAKGRATFTFSGFDEGDEVSGRGWVKTDKDKLTGWFGFHLGDKSGFVAVKTESLD